MIYYRLLSREDKGTIARTEGQFHQQFIPGRGWVESGILMKYFWPDSDLFEQYEEISEEEALRVTGGVL